jgi:hypothetical protein
MQDRIQVKALRDCMIRVKWTDADNKEIRDGWIDMAAGESRGDFQYVMAIDLSMSNLPDEFEHLASHGLEKVPHPDRPGESLEAFGLVRLTRLS